MITSAENGRLGYRDVRRHLLSRITSGEFPLHSRLPTIQETCRELGVSYVTAQRAYRTLADEGMVRSVRGQASLVIAEAPRTAPAARVVGGLFRAVRARNDVDNYALEMYEAVCHELAAHGVGVLHRRAGEPAAMTGLSNDVDAGRVAGVIADEVTPDAALERLARSGAAVTLYGRSTGADGVDWACPDHELNGRLAARAILARGYDRAALCKAPRPDLHTGEGEALKLRAAKLYFDSLETELRRLGFAGGRVVTLPEEAFENRDPWYDADGVTARIGPLAAEAGVRTAFVGVNDRSGLFMAEWLRARGLLGPGRCGVMGRYHHETNHRAAQPVSTWSIDAAEVGRAAVARLLERMEFPGRPATHAFVKPVFVDNGTL